ncbi:site-2 protease family protein [Cytobacillus kochii]|uniref:site-2 protease family protein n=1 Tax=Cytobacillus kochii TaxID=859143 RepID=UPI00203D6FC9|nr:site-2 protease family protein [Cytobacillus kochii]MCM3322454.1 site-2 protease family protein [Cytobacillus kochii]MCM3345068.1 site-2 protease family protein [Cytobacillus kochii]
MEQFLAYPLRDIPYVAITLIIAFTLHELAHAWVAYKFGDPTAKNQGRLTLNPISHLDPIGTLLIFIAGFGWARPVPVNRFFFKNPRLAGVCVSLAGPLSNFVLATFALGLWYWLIGNGYTVPESLLAFLNIFIGLNMLLFIFNLIPLPPLDGYRVIADLVPNDWRAKMMSIENYGGLIFLILVITPLSQYTISPILNTLLPAIMENLSAFFYTLFVRS